MSINEVQALILKRIDELHAEQKEQRKQMHAEHKSLGDRVTKIETQQRLLLWLIAPSCVAVGAVIRELLGRLF